MQSHFNISKVSDSVKGDRNSGTSISLLWTHWGRRSLSKKVGNFLAPILKVLKITAQLCAPGLRSGMLTLFKGCIPE